MRKKIAALLLGLVAAGTLAAGCTTNIKVPRDQPCPAGYHRSTDWWNHHVTSVWCDTNTSSQ